MAKKTQPAPKPYKFSDEAVAAQLRADEHDMRVFRPELTGIAEIVTLPQTQADE
jgi:hypothetical protein